MSTEGPLGDFVNTPENWTFTYLANQGRPSPSTAESDVAFQHDDAGDTGRLFHAWTRLVEDAGTFQNVWTFSQTPGLSYGLTTQYDENNGAGTTLRRREFSYRQDEGGTPHLWTERTTQDPGTGYLWGFSNVSVNRDRAYPR